MTANRPKRHSKAPNKEPAPPRSLSQPTVTSSPLKNLSAASSTAKPTHKTRISVLFILTFLAIVHSSNAINSPANSSSQSPSNPLSVRGVEGVENAEATIAMLREQVIILQVTLTESEQTAFTSEISNITNRSSLQLTSNDSVFADVC